VPGNETEPRFVTPDAARPDQASSSSPSFAAGLDHERKQITVLFADITGSTELVADRDPDDARRLLDPILDRMVVAVQLYDGTVHRLMGDGIMALFGAPVAYEDHAIRACYSALRMQESIRKYAEEIHREERLHLQIRVGLNSGEVATGTRSGNAAMAYSVNGQSVHLAARMEQLAMPGTILMASQTFRLTQGYLETRYLGPTVVRGLATPVETYELQGANTARSRLDVAAARGLSRFVGRNNEIFQLQQAAEQVEKGYGQLIAVMGEPGVGKSRLIREFVRTKFTTGWRIIEADTVSASYGATLSYHPITELLKEYFRVATSNDASEVHEKVRAKLLNLGQRFLPLLPTLLTLLDISQEESQRSNPDVPQRGQSVLETVKQLLFRESELQPLLVVVEDIHAVDPDTQALVNGLVDSLHSARILFIVSYRPEFRHGWGNKSYCTQIRMEPLDVGGAQELFDALVEGDDTVEPLKRLLIERTAGNPFFLEESIRTLVESGVLLGEPGSYTVAKAVSELNVPATVESLLASRIDRLHPGDKRLLLSAAVIGYHVPLGVLEAVAKLTPVALRQALDRLQTSEFLHETSLFPDVEYTFRHALIHDVAYRNVSLDRRRILHTAALSEGENLYSGQLIEKSDWLAFHAFRGQQWDRAVGYFRTAAAQAIRLAASRNAVQHLENALMAAGHFSIDERASLEIDLRVELRHALTPLGQVQKTLDSLAAAEALATSMGDRPRLARIVSFTACCLVNQARHTEALATGARALAITRELHDLPLEIATRMYMARARLARAEFQEAVKILKEIIQALNEKSADDFLGLPMLPATAARSVLALSLAQTGNFRDAATQASEAASRASTSRQPDSIVWGNWSLGVVAMQRGASDEAVGIFKGLCDLCRTHDLDAYTSRAIAGLGCAKARLGQVKEGLQLLQSAVAMDASAEPMTTRSFALNALAEVLFLAGEEEDAIAACNQTLQFTREHEERGAEAYAYFLLGLIHNTQIGELDAARDYLQAAASMASGLGLRPLLAHCHLAFAEWHHKQGNAGLALEHKERGHDMLNTLEMKQWFVFARETASGTRLRLST
jgi:predicted ATPase/class 3 adenylate cyclase